MTKFALVGSGEYLPPMEAVDRALVSQVPGPPRVVCLPTAAGTEGTPRIDYWMQLGVEHFTRLGVQVESLPVINRTKRTTRPWRRLSRQPISSISRAANLNTSITPWFGTEFGPPSKGVLAQGGLLAG